MDADKTRVYLERSNPSPINLSLRREDDLTSRDTFFPITPQAITRLKSLSVQGTLWNLQDITAHLAHPAPLLEDMSIIGSLELEPEEMPVLTPALFNGDLTSLRELCLQHVRTELPWRNMDNLMSLSLANTSPASVRQLLDFFESAPHLREVDLSFETPIPDAQTGRLVLLARLESMSICGLSSVLLDHLLIRVGTCLDMEVDLPTPPIGDHPPRFIDNLRNLPNSTTIYLCQHRSRSHMDFSGPNGEVNMLIFQSHETFSLLESLTQFDTSKTKNLELVSTHHLSSATPYQALLPMKDLLAIAIYQCSNPVAFIHALDPNTSPSGVVCPKLEELEIEYRETLDINDIIGMAAARASRGAKLKSVKITYCDRSAYSQLDVLELKRHVLHVELEICGFPDVGDGDGEREWFCDAPPGE